MAKGVTIGALRYDIIADTEKFERTMTATAAEIRQQKKVFRETQTPAEKYGAAIDRLNNLRRKGLISSQQYSRALKREADAYRTATKSATMLNRSFGVMGPHLKGMLTSLTAIAGIGGMSRAVMGEMAAIDELAKASQKLGLATDQLVAFQLAGEELAGMAGPAVNQALQRMTRRISEAAAGTGEAQEALKELGLSARVLNEIGPGAALREIADAMQGVSSEQDQLRLAFKLFDSEGAAFVNVLKQGSEGLDAMSDRARELGLMFGDDVAKNVQEANDALTEMQSAVKGLARSWAAELAPVIKEATDGLTDWYTWWRKLWKDAPNEWLTLWQQGTPIAPGARQDVRVLGGDPEIAARRRRERAREQEKQLIEEARERAKLHAQEQKLIDQLFEQAKQDVANLNRREAEMEKAAEQERRLAIKEQQEAVKLARTQLTAFDREARRSFSFGQVGAQAGSSAEYQFFAQRQRQQLEAKERQRHHQESQAARERLERELAKQTQLLEDLKTNPTIATI